MLKIPSCICKDACYDCVCVTLRLFLCFCCVSLLKVCYCEYMCVTLQFVFFLFLIFRFFVHQQTCTCECMVTKLQFFFSRAVLSRNVFSEKSEMFSLKNCCHTCVCVWCTAIVFVFVFIALHWRRVVVHVCARRRVRHVTWGSLTICMLVYALIGLFGCVFPHMISHTEIHTHSLSAELWQCVCGPVSAVCAQYHHRSFPTPAVCALCNRLSTRVVFYLGNFIPIILGTGCVGRAKCPALERSTTCAQYNHHENGWCQQFVQNARTAYDLALARAYVFVLSAFHKQVSHVLHTRFSGTVVLQRSVGCINAIVRFVFQFDRHCYIWVRAFVLYWSWRMYCLCERN